MKLGTRGRYAVMAMVDLAESSHKGPVPLSEIANRQEISLSYLEQLFGKLRQQGLVQSVRGSTGGYILPRSASLISVADIVSAADKPFKATRCSSSKQEGCLQSKSRCKVHHLWEELGSQINGFLQSISLQDVLENKIQK
ncbi:MAG: Rrf2 family transcriptional regulator [Alphaproteobacteria bacterium]